MKFKPNVTVCFTTTNIWIMECFKKAYREVLGKEPTCTGGQEGTHNKTSGHFHGRALDFRHGLHWKKPLMTREQAKAIKGYCLNYLHNAKSEHQRRANLQFPITLPMGTYYIKIESDHFHVQRNKGEV